MAVVLSKFYLLCRVKPYHLRMSNTTTSSSTTNNITKPDSQEELQAALKSRLIQSGEYEK